MAVMINGNNLINNLGMLSFSFLNRKGNVINIEKVEIKDVYLLHHGKRSLMEDSVIMNNHLNIFIDAKKHIRFASKFTIAIEYCYKTDDSEILTHKHTVIYEPITQFQTVPKRYRGEKK